MRALLAAALLATLPPAPPRCHWHELEQGGAPEHRYVLVCDGPPPSGAPAPK